MRAEPLVHYTISGKALMGKEQSMAPRDAMYDYRDHSPPASQMEKLCLENQI